MRECVHAEARNDTVSTHGASGMNPLMISARTDFALQKKTVEVSCDAVSRTHGVFMPGCTWTRRGAG